MVAAVLSEAVVSEALHQLYSPVSSPRVRRRADSLLQQFQRSPQASVTALAVLQNPIVITGNAEHDALERAKRVFSASTIYFSVAMYIRKYKLDDVSKWTLQDREQHELVVKNFGQMAQNVWNVLTGPCGTQEELNVQTYLALTVAVILLRFHEPQGNATVIDAVEWLVKNQEHPIIDRTTAALSNFAVLLTLKVIPEEVDNKRVKFAKFRRDHCEDMVQICAAHVVRHVLPLIAGAIDANEEQKQLGALLLQTFASWVEHGTVPPAVLMECGLLDRAFCDMLLPSSSLSAMNAVREVVRVCQQDEHAQLMECIMHNFVILRKKIQECIAANEKSLDFCVNDCARAISECGQAFITYFVDYTLNLQPGSLVYEFLDAILFFTSLNLFNTSHETMDFWVDFRTYISGKYEQRMFGFETFISRLMNILIERTEFPKGFEDLSDAAKERFFLFRSEARNVFRALVTVSVASEDKFIVDAIHAVFQQYEIVDSGSPLPTNWWQHTEVYVHALSAVSKSIREEDTCLMPRLLGYLSRKEPSHRALLRTITIFLGMIGHWFAKHPEYLSNYAFEIIFYGLKTQDELEYTSSQYGQKDHVGAVALRKLTSRCGSHFFNPLWIEALVDLYRLNCPMLGGSSKICLTGDSARLIVDSICRVLTTVSYKDALPVIDELGAIIFAELSARCSQANTYDESPVEFLSENLRHLFVLATRISVQLDQNTPHPILCVLQRHWEILKVALSLYGCCEEVAESFCTLLVGVFESLRSQALNFASAIVPSLLEQFANSHYACYLSVIKSIIGCAGDDDATSASLVRVFTIVSETSMSKIAADGSVDQHSGLTIALFTLVASCGTHHPSILARSNQLESVLALALHALKSQNPDVGAATLDFLFELSSLYGQIIRTPDSLFQGPELAGKLLLHEQIQTLLFEKDVQYHILFALFNAAAGGMAPNLMEKIAEVVRSCWVYFGRQRSEELINRLLSDRNFKGSQVSDRARTEFLNYISTSISMENSRKFKRVLNTFCDHFKRTLAESAMLV
ncbi:Nuclear transport regulator [Plasmopara halstedii]|uniref:Nuclear transport regulator n=1 Tax=Plasmopara halstedii TaxID=4781 RepID=A0A0P1AFT2_PLAHL|nr:Nuclear transport regulator [Plasmopara halstedii]CEG39455.1 Nuclear transport regulator [Plasmopara halstedii]|eukprot:XP_024575824.1 Nuclear transport regulator [Plasmopara halstedii]